MNRYTSILNGGSIAGLVAFAYFLLLYAFMGQEFVLIESTEPFYRETMTLRIHPFGGIRIFGVIVPVVFMYIAMKRFRKEEGEGFLTFARGFRVGVLFTFIYGSLSAMLIFLFGSLVDGSFVEFANTYDTRLLELTKESGRVKFIDIDEQLTLIKQRDLVQFALSDFWSKTTSGFLIALIVAAIVKQKPPTFVEHE